MVKEYNFLFLNYKYNIFFSAVNDNINVQYVQNKCVLLNFCFGELSTHKLYLFLVWPSELGNAVIVQVHFLLVVLD